LDEKRRLHAVGRSRFAALVAISSISLDMEHPPALRLKAHAA
jgi:hypothetical protein